MPDEHPRPPAAPEALAALAELVLLALDAVENGEQEEAEDLLQQALARLADLGAEVEVVPFEVRLAETGGFPR
jgi:Asp-tRNA(Asn)/Glu-tRNA(Gln) amidotransferase A subunit family amidase